MQSKTSTWSAVNSVSSKLAPAIWSRDTGQRLPCFDRCQLIKRWRCDTGHTDIHGGVDVRTDVRTYGRS